MSDRYIVIMAGGKGERFWPASRLKRPKHLLPIVGDKPMLTQTVDRLGSLIPIENIFVITNSEQVEGVHEVCPNLPEANVVAEPVGRDTAAAVGLAMLLVKRQNPEATLAMLPADAFIKNSEAFQGALDVAFKAAEASANLVTIGIQPTEPATGYGYINRGEVCDTIEGREVFKVKQFKEKPDLETAKEYLASGEYFWNAGMFVWSVAAIEGALSKYTPVLKTGLDEIESGLVAGKELKDLLEELYPTLEKISVDFAIMEKADNVVTMASTFDWDDVGAWPAIERHFPKDESGNVCDGLAVFEDSSDNIVVGSNGHLVGLVGVEGLIVVHTKDATLVCKKDEAQKIKALVKGLGASGDYKDLL
ncbi:NTP transferase domain-containing protein [Puniceicoccaceae bacterium K14]|nr:NTP transferase domain-containing protein [Puniceicoccaceae bacterium K14]